MKQTENSMKHFCYFVLIGVVISVIVACSSENNKQVDALQAKIDSLQKSNKDKDKDMQEMTSFVNVISMSLDSIKVFEDSVLYGNANKESPKITKEQIRHNLEDLTDLIGRQKQQLSQLRKQLESAKGENAENMKKMVAFFEAQLKEKDAQIARLRAELNQKNVDITLLKNRVDNLTTSNQELEQRTEEQSSALKVQSDMMNTCYVKIGTKKELKAAGLLTGGFLKKTKLDNSKLSPEYFTVMDMRKCNDILIKSSNPKILTQMPASSYEIIENEDETCYLHIIDPNAFWSVSKYLVIQL